MSKESREDADVLATDVHDVITKQKFDSLLNGGGAAAGVKGLTAEIKGLETEIETARSELSAMPAKRADLILADNSAAALDKLESRERELERLIERNTIQIEGLNQRVATLRRTELAPRIAHHQRSLLKIEGEIAAAVRQLMALNQSAADALKAALDELGNDGAPLLASVEFGGVPTQICVDIWAGNLRDQRDRIARLAADEKPASRSPAFNLNDLQAPQIRATWR